MKWIALAFIAIPFLVITGFVFVFRVAQLVEQPVWCPWYIKAVAYVWLGIGLLADVLFNWTWGCIIFRERPRKWTMTARVKHHARGPDGWRKRKALQWAEMLNAVDPGHIK